VLTGRPMREDRPNELSAETIGVNFARRRGIDGVDAAALTKLRALSVAEIVDGGQESAGPGGPVTYSSPILDGRLTVPAALLKRQGGASGIDKVSIARRGAGTRLRDRPLARAQGRTCPCAPAVADVVVEGS
jgi:hypothetical protein